MFYIKIREKKGVEFQRESINQIGHLFRTVVYDMMNQRAMGLEMRERNLLGYSEMVLFLTSKYVVSSARLLKYSLDRMVWASSVLRLKVRSLPWMGRI